MKKRGDHTYHDIKTVVFDLEDSEFGFDRFEANVDVWWIDEPDVNLAYVKDIWVNSLKKNGYEIDYNYKEPDDEIKSAIINELENML